MQSQQTLGGRYVIHEVLGRGGMSVVYRGHDEVLGRDVAVKLLAGTDASARDRIRAEARAAARLSHPHVTNVYDYGESTSPDGGDMPYVVMELLPGQTLARRLTDGPMPPRAGLRICAEVAEALAAAHAQGLVHRDIKPENVMLTPTGAKVVDFGIAAVVGAPEVDPDGQLMGTPAYLAPERLTAGEVVPASDVYALGLLLHRVLAERLPWESETTTQMLTAHVYVEPAELPRIAGVPEQVRDLCRRCLAKDPADRPSAAEAARVLARAAGPVSFVDEPGDTGTADGARRRRRMLVVTGSAVVAVLAAALLADRIGDAETLDGATGPSAFDAGTRGAVPTGADGSAVAGGGGVEGSPGAGGPAVAPSARPPAPGAPAPSSTAAFTTADPTPTSPGPTPASSGRPSTTAAQTTAPATASSGGTPLTALGGVVTVLCQGARATLVGLVPGPGYQVKDYDPGPAKEVQAVLLSDRNESEIKVTCQRGRPVPTIKESPQ
ncbi:serine/threonine-protein kinase [Micromonospora sp. BQ11]|uniref:serine/threonine-protein kinase n=1 Tax=Micromonospora sp. BQ11 TaxID=3452212 RepID=UPI003F8860F7